ncbi:hypothetical protein ACFSCV_05900 [Methylopila henanensis]|uniref:DUF982 domain-containing protein n=1 Tax=Methylopila henanensis TaxID=873516 RepID=A0ABW4K6H1_9HYPH
MSSSHEASKRPAAPGAVKRRALPQGRSPSYEIDFPRRPKGVSIIAALFGSLREAWSRGGEAVADAYASSARVVLDHKEALEDLAAERRHGPRPEASTKNRAAKLESGS